MKPTLFDTMDRLMGENENIYFLFGDLGYPRANELIAKYPGRAMTVGASEQCMMDIAVGMAYEGKKVFTYTITPFYWRAAETLRTYIDYERLPVVMIGVGQDGDYSDHGDGFSHDARDIKELFNIFDRVISCYPQKEKDLVFDLESSVESVFPMFINIKR